MACIITAILRMASEKMNMINIARASRLKRGSSTTSPTIWPPNNKRASRQLFLREITMCRSKHNKSFNLIYFCSALRLVKSCKNMSINALPRIEGSPMNRPRTHRRAFKTPRLSTRPRQKIPKISFLDSRSLRRFLIRTIMRPTKKIDISW